MSKPEQDDKAEGKLAEQQRVKAPELSRDQSAKLESDPSKSSYAGYLFGISGTADRPAWSDSARGRGMIRLLSRGVAGAGFFVLGGHIAKKQMEGYDSFMKLSELKPLQNGKPLQYVAKAWDKAVGRPIEWATYHLTRGDAVKKADAAWEVTNFRSKLYNRPAGAANFTTDRYGYTRYLNGRGLGEEVVSITFDFFMASIGDAATRNIIQAFDPNVKQNWWIDDQGHASTKDKGHFDAKNWSKSLGRATWRVLSKNAAEDWAAALPYVYQMKWQRQALAKVWHGFKLSADHGWNGGVAQVETSGAKAGQVVGGYQMPGVLDLQTRFMGYNWYTLMYREAYDAIGRNIHEWRRTGHIKMPEFDNPVQAVTDTLGFGARYITKSLIKSAMYMAPAVPFFWITRTPQSKWRGGFVDKALATEKDANVAENAFLTLHPHGPAAGKGPSGSIFTENFLGDLYPRAHLIHDTRDLQNGGKIYYGSGRTLEKVTHGSGAKSVFDMKHPYEFKGVHRTPFERVLNVFGAASYHTGTGFTKVIDKVAPKGDMFSRALFKEKNAAGKLVPMQGEKLLLEREKMARMFVDASFSYTPYMWAKAETGLRVDDRRSSEQLGQMDKAIYRFLDNTFTFNFKGAWQALGDMATLGTHIEKVKSREGGASPTAGVGDGTTVPHRDEAPDTKIEARTVRHGRRATDKIVDPEQERQKEQRSWAEDVTGRKLDAQLVNTPSTIH